MSFSKLVRQVKCADAPLLGQTIPSSLRIVSLARVFVHESLHFRQVHRARLAIISISTPLLTVLIKFKGVFILVILLMHISDFPLLLIEIRPFILSLDSLRGCLCQLVLRYLVSICDVFKLLVTLWIRRNFSCRFIHILSNELLGGNRIESQLVGQRGHIVRFRHFLKNLD